MNTVLLTGRLTADPSYDHRSGRRCRFWLAAQARRCRPTLIEIEVRGAVADACGAYLCEGRTVAVSGRLDNDDWTDPAGVTHYSSYVAATSVEFLDHQRTPTSTLTPVPDLREPDEPVRALPAGAEAVVEAEQPA